MLGHSDAVMERAHATHDLASLPKHTHYSGLRPHIDNSNIAHGAQICHPSSHPLSNSRRSH